MADSWDATTMAAAAAVGVAGTAAYMWAMSDPDGYKIDLTNLETQSMEHPVRYPHLYPASNSNSGSGGTETGFISSLQYFIFSC